MIAEAEGLQSDLLYVFICSIELLNDERIATQPVPNRIT